MIIFRFPNSWVEINSSDIVDYPLIHVLELFVVFFFPPKLNHCPCKSKVGFILIIGCIGNEDKIKTKTKKNSVVFSFQLQIHASYFLQARDIVFGESSPCTRGWEIISGMYMYVLVSQTRVTFRIPTPPSPLTQS